MPKVTIYTDGAAKGNPGNGGYGIVMMSGKHKKELSEGFRLTTNNRMELLSVIIALETIKKPSEVQIYSDSKYVVDSVEKKWVFGWQKKGFKVDHSPSIIFSPLSFWRSLMATSSLCCSSNSTTNLRSKSRSSFSFTCRVNGMTSRIVRRRERMPSPSL